MAIDLPVPMPNYFENLEFPVDFGEDESNRYVSRPELAVEPQDDDSSSSTALHSSHSGTG